MMKIILLALDILFPNNSPETELNSLFENNSPEAELDILFENNFPEAAVKIIDFGIARKFSSYECIMNRQVGTKTVIYQIMRCDSNFNKAAWEKISKEGKCFVACLLHKHPGDKDMNFVACLLHKYSGICLNPGEAQQHTRQLSTERLGVKKISFKFIARISQSEEIIKLRDLFCECDKDRVGCLSFREFKNSLQKYYTVLMK